MALIKCPECGKKMSDQAESCPHCGYSFEKKKGKSDTFENLKGKWNNKYLLVLLVVAVGIYFFFFSNNPNQKTTEGTGSNPTTENKPNTNGNLEFNKNGKYFVFPNTYKAYISKDGSIYVGKHIDNNGALIPYVMIEKYRNYYDPKTLLSELTTAIGKEYQDATITIDLLSNYIGNKYVYGIQYTYTSSNHVVVDNRYAFLVGSSMYLVTTKEENVNTTEINNVAKMIIESLKEVN